MAGLIFRYRAYLVSKAVHRSGLSLVNEMGFQSALWLLLPLIVAGLCWLAKALGV